MMIISSVTALAGIYLIVATAMDELQRERRRRKEEESTDETEDR